MTVCEQCNGAGACIGTESGLDLSANTETMKMSGPQPGSIPCTQCNGKGYQTYGNGA